MKYALDRIEENIAILENPVLFYFFTKQKLIFNSTYYFFFSH